MDPSHTVSLGGRAIKESCSPQEIGGWWLISCEDKVISGTMRLDIFERQILFSLSNNFCLKMFLQ